MDKQCIECYNYHNGEDNPCEHCRYDIDLEIEGRGDEEK